MLPDIPKQPTKKRKLTETTATVEQPPRKRKTPHDLRHIPTQPVDAALSNGELSVGKFVAAREFEIRALESGMMRARKALNTRAFQEVPRDMRRRTASHNVKKVPSRLRGRARKEMMEDNTPVRKMKLSGHQRMRLETVARIKKLSARSIKKKLAKKTEAEAHPDAMEISVSKDDEDPETTVAPKQSTAVKTRKPKVKKGVLKTPSLPPAKFRKRQIHKSWLPTHLYHAKRAHMTLPKEPLWRFAVPLTPTEKSYRPTHRASALRGAIAWDSSYMSTIRLEGQEKSLLGLLKAIGVAADVGFESLTALSGRKWRRGLRVWEGWVYEREGWPNKAIAPTTIMWNPEVDEKQGGDEMEGAIVETALPKKAKRSLFIRIHPAGFLQLWDQIVRLAKVQKPSVTVEDLRFEIGSIEITGPASAESLVSTLHPNSTQNSASTESGDIESIWNSLAGLSNSSLLPGNALLSFTISDPRLHHPPRTVRPAPDADAQEKLLRLCTAWPLDKTVRPIALFERAKRQSAARALPSQKSINRRKSLASVGEYAEPRPKDPKIPVLVYVSQCGNGNQGSWTVMMPWKCILPAWYPLMYYPLSTGRTPRFGGLEEKRQIAFESGNPWFPADYPGTKAGLEWELHERVKVKAAWERKPKGRRLEWESLDLGLGRKGEIGMGWACDWVKLVWGAAPVLGQSPDLAHIPMARAQTFLSKGIMSQDAKNGLATIKIIMVTRGVPQNRARIYRLPTNNADLRRKWITLHSDKGKRQAAKPGVATYPSVPDEVDLIGFVTTGNFNLSEGKAVGIGSLLLSKILPLENSAGVDRAEQVVDKKIHNASTSGMQNICIVRDAGETLGRLARWMLV